MHSTQILFVFVCLTMALFLLGVDMWVFLELGSGNTVTYSQYVSLQPNTLNQKFVSSLVYVLLKLHLCSRDYENCREIHNSNSLE